MVPVDIAGLTLSETHIWQIAGVSFGLALFLMWTRRVLIKRKLFKLCGVPTSSYRLLGTTLFWLGHPVRLQKNYLTGTPGTVFLKKNGKSAYICHFNPRMFNGRVKVRERYQMTLFMGLVNELYKPDKISGAIHYRDHLETIKFEPVIYRQLLDIRDEYREAIQEWQAPNPRPLFNREQHF